MTTYPKKVSCAKLEINPDGSQNWSQPELGFLSIGDHELSFENWTIPYSNIENAILNRHKSIFTKHYSLLLETKIGSYLFNLDNSEVWENLPFEYERTEGDVLGISGLIKFVIIIFVLQIIFFIISEIIK